MRSIPPSSSPAGPQRGLRCAAKTFRMLGLTFLLGKDGGYFRLIGIATPQEATRVGPEFPKIAHSFAVMP